MVLTESQYGATYLNGRVMLGKEEVREHEYGEGTYAREPYRAALPAVARLCWAKAFEEPAGRPLLPTSIRPFSSSESTMIVCGYSGFIVLDNRRAMT
jgi:hypothetical protein